MQVGVQQQQYGCAGGLPAGENSLTLSLVLFVLDQDQAWILLHAVVNAFDAVIDGTIVDDNDLIQNLDLFQDIEKDPDRLRLVEDR